MSDRVTPDEVAGILLTEAVGAEERAYIKWKSVGRNYRLIYKNREEMLKDQAKLAVFILRGFSAEHKLLFANRVAVLLVKPKHLDVEKRRIYFDTQSMMTRFTRYFNLALDSTYPSEKTIVENLLKGLVYHSDEHEGFVDDDGNYVKSIKGAPIGEGSNKKVKPNLPQTIAKVSDLYRTRDEDAVVVMYFLNKLRTERNFTSVIDPMCGKGDLIDLCKSFDIPAYGSDKFNFPECAKDFLSHTFKVNDDEIILSCPPFVTKEVFVSKSLMFNVPTILLLPVGFVATKKFTDFREALTAILIMSPRPKFINSKEELYSPKGTAYGWYFFNFPKDIFNDNAILYANKLTGTICDSSNKFLSDYDRKNVTVIEEREDESDVDDNEDEDDDGEEVVVNTADVNHTDIELQGPIVPKIGFYIDKDGKCLSRSCAGSFWVSALDGIFKHKKDAKNVSSSIGAFDRITETPIWHSTPPTTPNLPDLLARTNLELPTN